MKKTQLIIAGALALLVIGGGATAYIVTQDNDTKSTEQSIQKTDDQVKVLSSSAEEFSYQGQDGKTALELLQKATTTVMKGEGEFAYVTSINGTEADSTKNQYWSFLINDEMSMVGAGSYTTNSSDVIKWELASF
jgi:hypothetical protein